MSIDAIFYMQLGSLVSTILVVFGLYRLLVAQKDSVIQLLKERLAAEEKKVQELKSQSPDALTAALSSRISIMNEELDRMRGDGLSRQSEIAEKEQELHSVHEQLLRLTDLVKDSELVCPACGSPLSQRGFETITGVVGGRELEADIEYRIYECGSSFRDNRQMQPCRAKAEQNVANPTP